MSGARWKDSKIIIIIIIIIMYIYISTCAWYLSNERKRKYLSKKKKEKIKERMYRGKQKVKSIGHVIGGNELILKKSLKNIQHFWVFHSST